MQNEKEMKRKKLNEKKRKKQSERKTEKIFRSEMKSHYLFHNKKYGSVMKRGKNTDAK